MVKVLIKGSDSGHPRNYKEASFLICDAELHVLINIMKAIDDKWLYYTAMMALL